MDVSALSHLLAERSPVVVLLGPHLNGATIESSSSLPPSLADAQRDPGVVWSHYGPRMQEAWEQRPGPAHRALRALHDAGLVSCVIAESDDILLDEAGVPGVVDLRGSLRLSSCPQCGYTEPIGCLIGILPAPRCAACGELLRPGSLLADEPTPADVVEHARTLARAAQLLIVAGSRLDRGVAADLPGETLERGGAVALVGSDSCAYRGEATLRLEIEPADALDALARENVIAS